MRVQDRKVARTTTKAAGLRLRKTESGAEGIKSACLLGEAGSNSRQSILPVTWLTEIAEGKVYRGPHAQLPTLSSPHHHPTRTCLGHHTHSGRTRLPTTAPTSTGTTYQLLIRTPTSISIPTAVCTTCRRTRTRSAPLRDSSRAACRGQPPASLLPPLLHHRLRQPQYILLPTHKAFSRQRRQRTTRLAAAGGEMRAAKGYGGGAGFGRCGGGGGGDGCRRGMRVVYGVNFGAYSSSSNSTGGDEVSGVIAC